MNSQKISNENFEKNITKTEPINPEEIPIRSNYIFLNQGDLQTPQPQNQKKIKFDTNNISVIPLKQSYNLRYASDENTYNNLNDNIKDIINDPKYNSEQRSKSAYSKKSFREKFESMKLKVPEIKKWNCDPTAEIIIHNLEQKIDILTYENFLLTKQIKELVSNNKSLQLDLNQKVLLLRTEKQINDENLKMSQREDNFVDKKKMKKAMDNNAELLKEINLLKEENFKLKKSNDNLARNNMELNKIIEELKNEMKMNQNNFEEEFEKIKKLYENKLLEQNENNRLLLEQKLSEQNENNRLLFEQKLSEQNEKNKLLLIKKLSEQNEKNKEINNNTNNNEEYNNNIYNNSFNDNQKSEQNSNSTFDMNKYLQNEEQYKKLIDENERLHKQLRILLSIDEEEDINKFSSSFQDNNQNFIISPIKVSNINDIKSIRFNKINENLNINEKNNNIKNEINIQSEDIMKENHLLKQKIKSLSNELNKVTHEHNQKLLEIQEKFKEYESKNRTLLTKDNTNNEINENEYRKEEELDRILNETILMYINNEDEESKKMISTLKNIKNNQKKRISQCLIINNKLKSLTEENILLQNQLESMKKSINLMNTNNNLSSSLNLNNCIGPHLCYCGRNHESYDYLINALKIKDEIIMKYKEQNEENENKNKELIIENYKLKETEKNNVNRNNLRNNYKNNINNNNNDNEINNCNHHYIKKDVKINTMKRERANGLEDYLLGKIVNNQREVLGERAPRFDEGNAYEYLSKSVQCEPNNGNRMNNKYNNYHYREKRITNY